MEPLTRFYNLLQPDRKDVLQVIFYAIFAGLVSLSLPLGIQSIINFIQAGRVSVSWIVLIILVVIGVILVGILSFMQLRITENIQQKLFVRSSFEFAARLPKLKPEILNNLSTPELANRFFDTLILQKGKLLLDFSAALLQIVFGLLLLSLYHPFFIAFGLLLLALLYFIFRYSYQSGIKTSLKESKYKYKSAGWLQEIARNKFSFKQEVNFNYVLQKNDGLVQDYLGAREKHFAVIKTQFTQLIIFKVIITASLLSIGGFLVLQQQINIGQFVAAEIVILLVINSVEKIILGLETFYDVLTAVEKIGEVTDMQLEEEVNLEHDKGFENINIEVENVVFQYSKNQNPILNNISLQITQGEKIFLSGSNGSGKTTLIRMLSGLIRPNIGKLFINDENISVINLNQYRCQIGSVIQGETLFEGTIMENITFKNEKIQPDDLRWITNGVQLTSVLKGLPKGLETKIYPNDHLLSSSDAQKILLARSMVNKPLILFYEDPTNAMDEVTANEVINFILQKDHGWTVVITSKNEYWKSQCNREIFMESGTIKLDLKC
jgi:ABC-type bacteriocin/lantibiotic exporter with double-glycine peptidase domain